jgi:chemosensory pili system protein ChpA (sensor histidine kinase/response regulator)
MQANDIWREFCAGHQESLVTLLEYVDWLSHQARQTECAPLVKLIDTIGDMVTYLHDHSQETSEELAMEMATALLLVESIIDDFYKLPDDLPYQIDVIDSRLHGITTGDIQIGELPSAPTFKVLDGKTQEKELLAQVAQEILTNLAHIESILDKFFFEPAQRSELPLLPDLFKQVSGTLVMPDLEHAHTLLHHCHGLVEKLSKPGYEIVETEQVLLVDGLSSLGFYIEALRSGQPDSEQIVEEAIKLFQIAANATHATPPLQTATLPAAALNADTASAAAVSAAIDPELLGIFLEEAGEVLAGIAGDVRKCRINPTDQEALASARRGFHTLKGSGRMVRLDDWSEVAWNLEQVLNLWLSEK